MACWEKRQHGIAIGVQIMNELTIIGNLTRDPDYRTVNTAQGQTPVCTYTVAVNRPRRNGQDTGADFFRVTTWRQQANNDFRYLHKGDKVYVAGPVRAEVFTTRDGKAAASLEVTANAIEYLTPRGAVDNVPPSAPTPAPVQTRIDEQSGFEQVDVDDLPF